MCTVFSLSFLKKEYLFIIVPQMMFDRVVGVTILVCWLVSLFVFLSKLMEKTTRVFVRFS